MSPFFTIITPTLQRQSLVRSCESVTAQSFKEWQHIVMIDCEVADENLIRQIDHPQRAIIKCAEAHKDYGNSCRHNAWPMARGQYVLYLDDDNYLSDSDVLRDIAAELHKLPAWAIFPIMRHGSRFFNDPPGLCMTDTANVVARKDMPQWPAIPDYTADGIWVEWLKHYPYQAFAEFRPIVVMEKSNEGRA